MYKLQFLKVAVYFLEYFDNFILVLGKCEEDHTYNNKKLKNKTLKLLHDRKVNHSPGDFQNSLLCKKMKNKCKIRSANHLSADNDVSDWRFKITKKRGYITKTKRQETRTA